MDLTEDLSNAPRVASRSKRVAGTCTPTPNKAPAGVAADMAINVLGDSLGYTIKRAQMRTYEHLFAALGPDAISPGRLTALFLIGAQPGINQSALAEQLRVTRASVVKVIDSLAERGLVERRAVPDDRRSHALMLTDFGHTESRVLRQKIKAFEARIAQQLTPQEREQLIALLEKVAR